MLDVIFFGGIVIKELVLFILVFVLVYLFYVVFVLMRKNVLKKFPDGLNVMYLRKKYNVKITDKNIKKIANSVFLANSFILSTAVSIVSCFKSFIIGILVSIIPIILMILIIKEKLLYIVGKMFY